MAEPIRTFVVLDAGVNQDEVERVLPKSEEVEIVGLAHRDRRRLGPPPRDRERPAASSSAAGSPSLSSTLSTAP